MSRANDSAYDSAFTDSEAGTLSDIMSDFDLAASINGAVSLNGIDELRELKEGFHFSFLREYQRQGSRDGPSPPSSQDGRPSTPDQWCSSWDQVKTFERMVSQMCLFLIPVLMKSTSTVQKHFDTATRKPTAW